jgi:hypothetical protein
MNEHVVSNVCVTCTAGTTNAAGNDASDVDTDCDATLCEMNEHVVSNECVTCTNGTTNTEGNNASGVDTDCTIHDCNLLGVCVARIATTGSAIGPTFGIRNVIGGLALFAFACLI